MGATVLFTPIICIRRQSGAPSTAYTFSSLDACLQAPCMPKSVRPFTKIGVSLPFRYFATSFCPVKSLAVKLRILPKRSVIGIITRAR